MKPITAGVAARLEWTQPGVLHRDFALLADGEQIASLRFRSAFGTLATAESADGCWTFKRAGFWQRRVTVRACGSEADLATFQNNTWNGGGTLHMADGRAFRATTNFWQTRYEFLDEQDEPLVRFNIGGVFHMSAVVEILPAAHGLLEAPLMAMLGWYLAIMMHDDAAAAAT
jgi:hypothetical protein